MDPLEPDQEASLRDECAKLVEVMIQQKPWKDQMWARAALAIAARAIRRGRRLTEQEKWENLKQAMLCDSIDKMLPKATKA